MANLILIAELLFCLHSAKLDPSEGSDTLKMMVLKQNIVLKQGKKHIFLFSGTIGQIVRNEITPPHRSCIDTVVIIARGFIRVIMNKMILCISTEFYGKHIVKPKP